MWNIFTTEKIVGDKSRVSVNYDGLANDLSVGDSISVNNGLVLFKVKEIDGNNVICDVIAGGELSNRKSMSFPGKVLKKTFLSEQDKEDLLFGIENDVDFVAASFVSRKKDVEELRNFLDKNGGEDIDIVIVQSMLLTGFDDQNRCGRLFARSAL